MADELIPSEPQFQFDTKSQFLTAVRNKYPEYNTWNDNDLYAGWVQKYPDAVGVIRENLEPDSPVVAEAKAKAPPPAQWFGRQLNTPIEQLRGGQDYINLRQKQSKGRAGFWENITPGLEDIPFLGGGIQAVDSGKVLLTANKIGRGEDPTDQELLDLNQFLLENDRQSNATTVGKAGNIILGSVTFGVELMGAAATLGGLGIEVGGTKAAMSAAKYKALSVAEKAAVDFADLKMSESALGAARKRVESSVLAYTKKAGFGELSKRMALKTADALVVSPIVGALNVAGTQGAQAIYTAAAGENGPETQMANVRGIYKSLDNKAEPYWESATMGALQQWIEGSSEVMGGVLMEPIYGAAKGLIGRSASLTKAAEIFSNKMKHLRGEALKSGKDRIADLNARAPMLAGIAKVTADVMEKFNIDGDAALKWIKKAGYNGVIEEMAEERYGGFLHGLFGTQGDEAGLRNAFDQMVPTTDDAIAELMAFALPMQYVRGVNRLRMALTGTGYLSMGHQGEDVLSLQNPKDPVESPEKMQQHVGKLNVMAKESAAAEDTHYSKTVNWLLDLMVLPVNMDFSKTQYGTLDKYVGLEGGVPIVALYKKLKTKYLREGNGEGKPMTETEATAAADTEFQQIMQNTVRRTFLAESGSKEEVAAKKAVEEGTLVRGEAIAIELQPGQSIDPDLLNSAKAQSIPVVYMSTGDIKNKLGVQGVEYTLDDLQRVLTTKNREEALRVIGQFHLLGEETHQVDRIGADVFDILEKKILAPLRKVVEHQKQSSNTGTGLTLGSRFNDPAGVEHIVVARNEAGSEVTLKNSKTGNLAHASGETLAKDWKAAEYPVILTTAASVVDTEDNMKEFLKKYQYNSTDTHPYLDAKGEQRTKDGKPLVAFTWGAKTDHVAGKIYVNMNASSAHHIEDLFELLHFGANGNNLSKEAQDLMKSLIDAVNDASPEEEGKPRPAELKALLSALNDKQKEMFFKIGKHLELQYSPEYGFKEPLPFAKELAVLTKALPGLSNLNVKEWRRRYVDEVAKYLRPGWNVHFRNPMARAPINFVKPVEVKPAESVNVVEKKEVRKVESAVKAQQEAKKAEAKKPAAPVTDAVKTEAGVAKAELSKGNEVSAIVAEALLKIVPQVQGRFGDRVPGLLDKVTALRTATDTISAIRAAVDLETAYTQASAQNATYIKGGVRSELIALMHALGGIDYIPTGAFDPMTMLDAIHIKNVVAGGSIKEVAIPGIQYAGEVYKKALVLLERGRGGISSTPPTPPTPPTPVAVPESAFPKEDVPVLPAPAEDVMSASDDFAGEPELSAEVKQRLARPKKGTKPLAQGELPLTSFSAKLVDDRKYLESFLPKLLPILQLKYGDDPTDTQMLELVSKEMGIPYVQALALIPLIRTGTLTPEQIVENEKSLNILQARDNMNELFGNPEPGEDEPAEDDTEVSSDDRNQQKMETIMEERDVLRHIFSWFFANTRTGYKKLNDMMNGYRGIMINRMAKIQEGKSSGLKSYALMFESEDAMNAWIHHETDKDEERLLQELASAFGYETMRDLGMFYLSRPRYASLRIIFEKDAEGKLTYRTAPDNAMDQSDIYAAKARAQLNQSEANPRWTNMLHDMLTRKGGQFIVGDAVGYKTLMSRISAWGTSALADSGVKQGAAQEWRAAVAANLSDYDMGELASDLGLPYFAAWLSGTPVVAWEHAMTPAARRGSARDDAILSLRTTLHGFVRPGPKQFSHDKKLLASSTNMPEAMQKEKFESWMRQLGDNVFYSVKADYSEFSVKSTLEKLAKQQQTRREPGVIDEGAVTPAGARVSSLRAFGPATLLMELLRSSAVKPDEKNVDAMRNYRMLSSAVGTALSGIEDRESGRNKDFSGMDPNEFDDYIQKINVAEFMPQGKFFIRLQAGDKQQAFGYLIDLPESKKSYLDNYAIARTWLNTTVAGDASHWLDANGKLDLSMLDKRMAFLASRGILAVPATAGITRVIDGVKVTKRGWGPTVRVLVVDDTRTAAEYSKDEQRALGIDMWTAEQKKNEYPLFDGQCILTDRGHEGAQGSLPNAFDGKVFKVGIGGVLPGTTAPIIIKGALVPRTSMQTLGGPINGLMSRVEAYNVKNPGKEIHWVVSSKTAKQWPGVVHAFDATDFTPTEVPTHLVFSQAMLETSNSLHKINTAIQLIANMQTTPAGRAVLEALYDTQRQAMDEVGELPPAWELIRDEMHDIYAMLGRKDVDAYMKAQADLATAEHSGDEDKARDARNEMARLASVLDMRLKSPYLASMVDRAKSSYVLAKSKRAYAMPGIHAVAAAAAGSDQVFDSGKSKDGHYISALISAHIAPGRRAKGDVRYAAAYAADAASVAEDVAKTIRETGIGGDLVIKKADGSYIVPLNEVLPEHLRTWEFKRMRNPATGKIETVVPGSLMLVARTPGTGLESYILARLGFDPGEATGNIVYLHQETVRRAGVDFDGDKWAMYAIGMKDGVIDDSLFESRVINAVLQAYDKMKLEDLHNAIDTGAMQNKDAAFKAKVKAMTDKLKLMGVSDPATLNKIEHMVWDSKRALGIWVSSVGMGMLGVTAGGLKAKLPTYKSGTVSWNMVVVPADKVTGKPALALTRRGELDAGKWARSDEFLRVVNGTLTNMIVDNPTKPQVDALGINNVSANLAILAVLFSRPVTSASEADALIKQVTDYMQSPAVKAYVEIKTQSKKASEPAYFKADKTKELLAEALHTKNLKDPRITSVMSLGFMASEFYKLSRFIKVGQFPIASAYDYLALKDIEAGIDAGFTKPYFRYFDPSVLAKSLPKTIASLKLKGLASFFGATHIINTPLIQQLWKAANDRSTKLDTEVSKRSELRGGAPAVVQDKPVDPDPLAKDSADYIKEEQAWKRIETVRLVTAYTAPDPNSPSYREEMTEPRALGLALTKLIQKLQVQMSGNAFLDALKARVHKKLGGYELRYVGATLNDKTSGVRIAALQAAAEEIPDVDGWTRDQILRGLAVYDAWERNGSMSSKIGSYAAAIPVRIQDILNRRLDSTMATKLTGKQFSAAKNYVRGFYHQLGYRKYDVNWATAMPDATEGLTEYKGYKVIAGSYPESSFGVIQQNLEDGSRILRINKAQAPFRNAAALEAAMDAAIAKTATAMAKAPVATPAETVPVAKSFEIVKLMPGQKAPTGVFNGHRSGNMNVTNAMPGTPGALGNPYIADDVRGGKYTREEATHLFEQAFLKRVNEDSAYRNWVLSLRGGKVGYYKPDEKFIHLQVVQKWLERQAPKEEAPVVAEKTTAEVPAIPVESPAEPVPAAPVEIPDVFDNSKFQRVKELAAEKDAAAFAKKQRTARIAFDKQRAGIMANSRTGYAKRFIYEGKHLLTEGERSAELLSELGSKIRVPEARKTGGELDESRRLYESLPRHHIAHVFSSTGAGIAIDTVAQGKGYDGRVGEFVDRLISESAIRTERFNKESQEVVRTGVNFVTRENYEEYRRDEEAAGLSFSAQRRKTEEQDLIDKTLDLMAHFNNKPSRNLLAPGDRDNYSRRVTKALRGDRVAMEFINKMVKSQRIPGTPAADTIDALWATHTAAAKRLEDLNARRVDLGENDPDREEPRPDISFSITNYARIYGKELEELKLIGPGGLHEILIKEKLAIAALQKEETGRYNRLAGIFGRLGVVRDEKGKHLADLDINDQRMVTQFMWAATALLENPIVRKMLDRNATDAELLAAFDKVTIPYGNPIFNEVGEGKKTTLKDLPEDKEYLFFKYNGNVVKRVRTEIRTDSITGEVYDEPKVVYTYWSQQTGEKLDFAGKEQEQVELPDSQPTETYGEFKKRWAGSKAYKTLSAHKSATYRNDKDLSILNLMREDHAFYRKVAKLAQYIKARENYVPHIWGAGFPTLELQVAQDAVATALKNVTDKSTSATWLPENVYQIKFASVEKPAPTTEQIDLYKKLTGVVDVDLGRLTMWDMNVMLEHELRERQLEIAKEMGEKYDPKEVSNAKDLATIKKLNATIGSYRFKEWTARTMPRKLEGTYAQVYGDKRQRRSVTLPDGRVVKAAFKPKNMDAMALRMQYTRDIMAASMNQALIHKYLLTPDHDGTPLVIAIPSAFVDEHPLIPDALYRESATRWAKSIGKDIDPNADIRGQMEALARDYGKGYKELDSPYPSVAKFLVKNDGDTPNLLRHVIQAQAKWMVGDHDMLEFLAIAAQSSKMASVGWSLFFMMTNFETLIAGTGVKTNILVPKNMGDAVKQMREYSAQILAADPSMTTILSRMTKGRIELSETTMAGESKGAVERMNATVYENMRRWWGEDSAKRVAWAIDAISGKFFTDFFFGKAGKHAGLFPVFKVYAAQLWAKTEAKRRYGEDSVFEQLSEAQQVEIYRDISGFINSAVGASPDVLYNMQTPQYRQFAGLTLFAYKWTEAALQIFGAEKIFGAVYGPTMSKRSNELVGVNAAMMVALVLVGLPSILQSVIWATAGGDDDHPFPLQNEEGKMTYVDITPWARLVPGYKGDPTGKRREYMRWGKQFYEVADGWLTEPGNQFMRKLSQPAKVLVEQVTGRSPGSDWNLDFQGQGLRGWFVTSKDEELSFMNSRFGMVLQKFIPMSVLGGVKNPETFIAGALAPVSKGKSMGRATAELTILFNTAANEENWKNYHKFPQARANLEGLGAGILDAAARNGYDVSKIVNTAKGVVLSRLYHGFTAAMNNGDEDGMDRISKQILRVGGTIKGLQKSLVNKQLMTGQPKELPAEETAAIETAFNAPGGLAPKGK